MDSNWAVQNLQTIRTLMERSALYRRALAPIMLSAGFIGLGGGCGGYFLKPGTTLVFVGYWVAICAVVMFVTFFIARSQAIKESEPLLTPPTRRIAWALAAPFFGGAAMTLPVLLNQRVSDTGPVLGIISIWLMFYGCGLCSAGFFVLRGVKLLGSMFVLCGAFLVVSESLWPHLFSDAAVPHLIMGLTFGGLHLASGIYLYFTEPGKNAA